MVADFSFRRAMLQAAALICAGAAPAFAQEEETNVGSLYARLGVGFSFATSIDQDIDYNPGVAFIGPTPDRRITDYGEGWVAAAAVGFDYPAGTRTELEYRRLSAPIEDVREFTGVAITPPTPADGDVGVHYLMSNVYFRLARERTVTPYFGAGVGGAFVNDGRGNRDSSFAWQVRAGASVSLDDDFDLDVEYVHAWTRDLVFGADDFDETDAGPVRLSGDSFAAGSLMASLRKTF